MAQLRITWTKSYIGSAESHRRVVRSLGLRRLHQSVVHHDSPTIRGMVNKVQHLVSVEEIEEAPRQAAPRRRRRTTAAS